MLTRSPSILFIDDDPSQLATAERNLRAFGGVDIKVATPQEVELDQFNGIDLVLIDLQLGLEGSSLLTACDGVALASVLRRRLLKSQKSCPIGFAILTSELKGLAEPLPDTPRKPLLSAQHNLEWVFEKDEQNLALKIGSLARAIRDIPAEWGDGIDSVEEVAEQLGVQGAEDTERVWSSVERFKPPIYEISSWTHGLAFVRWLAQVALPYPTFLWNSHRVAARWRVEHSDFLTAYDESEAFRAWLAPSSYTGLLHDFDGGRWWRHRIEQSAWDETGGRAQDPLKLREVVGARAGRPLKPSMSDNPLVAIGLDARSVEDYLTRELAVRVHPDGWPLEADPAWMASDRLPPGSPFRKIVDDEDREKLS